jgi:glycosyltransferase involved in cell wall biosynthesis
VFNVLPPGEPSDRDITEARKLLEGMKGPIVLFAGRLTAGKGLEMLIDALPAVMRRVPETRLAVAGGGDPSPFKRRASNHLAGYALRFTGHVDNGVTLALMRMSHVVTVPSLHHEPLGRVLLEAISAGKPVVTTPYGGTPEVITHGENGLIVDPVDSSCLGEALSRAVTDTGLEARARDFDAELRRDRLNPLRTVEATLNAYERAIAA